MTLSRKLYECLPRPFRPIIRSGYRRLHPDRVPETEVKRSRDQFVADVFDSQAEYLSYLDELTEEPVASYLDEAKLRLEAERGKVSIGNEYFHDVYAYVRKTKPDVVVETGVRDGWSTLYILSALDLNNNGHLYSVDFPIRADEDDDEYKREAPSYEDISPTIPAGTNPGWIVPDSLHDCWTLRIGKSQTELPELFTELDHIDVFVHDSDHSLPCMMLEYELAWEWLGDEGIIFSDDISWNDAFDEFAVSKDCKHGTTAETFGYFQKEKTPNGS